MIINKRDLIFMCTGVYGPQEDPDKRIFLQELINIRARNSLPWLILGDFNLFRDITDTTGEVRNLRTMLDFNNFIDDIGLFEVQLQGRAFTWSNKRPSPTFSKLDRVLLSSHWNDCDASFDLRDLPATASDHVPLMLRITPHINPPKRHFKFEIF